ncbi:HAD family hydrolase [Roseofilum casamattae]|uniref:HAD family hydrolase n=1 Tax=Roseofilum casamattae BLCC-M143 TaxID=3022442 RepID=A0ABT7BX89_9CYAN|nr:HAD family hydrolase [Roseofilum casamattae]MDJ1183796.1 HAD family hydrolase [Roseofilum casamattae BLCC-M143]
MVTVICGNSRFADITAILLDKDGTLARSEPFLQHLARERARLIEARVPGVGDAILTAFGADENGINPAGLTAVGSPQENAIAAAAYIAQTGRDWLECLQIAQQAFDEANRLMGEKAEETQLLPGVAEVLQQMKQYGLKLAVVSSDINENIHKFLQRYQLADSIDWVQGAQDHLKKPDPQVFWTACEKLGVRPEQTLMVGDSPGDFTMAREAKAAGSIGVSWGWSLPPNLKAADVAIARLDEIQLI